VNTDFLCQTGNTLTRFIQSKLKSLNLWEEVYVKVEEQLTQVMNVVIILELCVVYYLEYWSQ